MLSLTKIASFVNYLSQKMVAEDGKDAIKEPVTAAHTNDTKSVDTELDELKDQHANVSSILRRSMYALLGFSAYCLLALGTTDKSLLVAADSITLPIIGAAVTYSGFLFVAPLVIIAITAHVHIFLSLLRKVEARVNGLARVHRPSEEEVLTNYNKEPAVFNLNTTTARIITNFLFYWLSPITVAAFYIKSLPRPEPEPVILLLVTSVLVIWMIVTGVRRIRSMSPHMKLAFASMSIIAIVVFVSIDMSARYLSINGLSVLPVNRTLHLYKAQLSGVDLRSYQLAKADLRDADMSGADLRGVNLERANLSGANLSGALLNESTMDEAIFEKTDLRGADLSNASIRNTRLIKVDMRKAKLQDADFSGTDMRRVENIVGVQLTQACGDRSTRMPLEVDEISRMTNCESNTSRKAIRSHYINVRGSRLEGEGRYWSDREQILDIVDSIEQSGQYRHLLIYFTNLLGSQTGTARSIAATKDIFIGNGVYPIFFIGDSGLTGEIREILIDKKLHDRDSRRGPKPEDVDMGAEGVLHSMPMFRTASMIKVGVSDWLDKMIERQVKNQAGILWSDIKYSAYELFDKGNVGYEIMSRMEESLGRGEGKQELHIVAEGSGALYLSEMLATARALKMNVSSISLIAPALTIETYKREILPLLQSENGDLSVKKLTIYVLPDMFEKDDDVGKIYRKSFLYLVSRALEAKQDTPILGLENYKDAIPNLEQVDYVVSQKNGGRSQSQTHGGFSNDAATMNDILSNITGTVPKLKFGERFNDTL